MHKVYTKKNVLFDRHKALPLISTLALSLTFSSFSSASGAKAYGDIRFRYENVQDNSAREDANAFVARVQAGIKTAEYNGFSAVIEMEANRNLFGVDEYSVPPSGFNPPTYSIIPDPEFTEIDQAFIQYKNDDVTAKLGSQVIVLDNQRYIGHVGWRMDRATHDALSINIKASDDLSLFFAYANERNRLFGEDQDQKAKDIYINAAYSSAIGKLTAYAYLLEDDFTVTTFPFLATGDRDTYGLRFNSSLNLGSQKVAYTAEYAYQELETRSGAEYSMSYLFLEAMTKINGTTLKLGHEVLGSDDGNNSFGTPLGTVHMFNGWADMFVLPRIPADVAAEGYGTPLHGLTDTYLMASGKAGPGKMTIAYHQYSDATSNGIGDYGSEFNAAYGMKFGKKYAGIKYANYKEDGYKFDAEKIWIWFGTKF